MDKDTGTDTYVVAAKNIFGTVRFFLAFGGNARTIGRIPKVWRPLKYTSASFCAKNQIFRTNHATTVTYCTLGAPRPGPKSIRISLGFRVFGHFRQCLNERLGYGCLYVCMRKCVYMVTL